MASCCGAAGNLNFHIQNNNDAPYLPISYNSWQLLTGIQDSSTYTTSMYYTPDAVQSTTGGSQYPAGTSAPLSIGRSCLGGGEYLLGAIAELRIYTEVVAPAARTLIESELRTKWGLSGS